MTPELQKDLINLINDLKPHGIRHLSKLLGLTRLETKELIIKIRNLSLEENDPLCIILRNTQKNS